VINTYVSYSNLDPDVGYPGGLPQSFQMNAGILKLNNARSLPSASFPLHHPTISCYNL